MSTYDGRMAMLRAIADAIADDGRCHTGHVVSEESDMPVLEELGRLGLIDTDLCSCCDRSTAHTITDKGRKLLILTGYVFEPEEPAHERPATRADFARYASHGGLNRCSTCKASAQTLGGECYCCWSDRTGLELPQ